MTYQVPSFDELLDQLLTDYKNLNGGADVEVLIEKLRAYQVENGTAPDVSLETLIRSACTASALWGAYKYQQYLGKQPFPDTADTENLNHHGAVQGIARIAGETDSGYLVRILDDIQNPPAGGNQYDYRQWADAISGVTKAYVFPLAQGDGTLDVVIVADAVLTGSEIPSMTARKGTATAIATGKLIDAAATFTTATAVTAGKIVRNTFQGTEATVVSVDSPTQLTISADIFKYVGEHYHVHMQTGTSTAVSANKLVDAAAAFNDSVYPVVKGDVAKNLTDNAQALVVSVDSAMQLTLDTDIFLAVGKTYVVESTLARVKEAIDAVRPVSSSKVDVLAPTVLSLDVTMGVSGSNVDRVSVKADIQALLNGYIPDQKLYEAQVTTLAIERGAEDCAITAPAVFPVVPASYQMIRPGTITVT